MGTLSGVMVTEADLLGLRFAGGPQALPRVLLTR